MSARAARRALLSALAMASTLATAPDAGANGRFPQSNQIVFAEHDEDFVLLRVTFGALVSRDRGKTFGWVCEKAIGFSGVEDPMYTITPSSTIVGTTYQGLAISRDGACGWIFAGGDLDKQVFIDLTANPKDKKNIVVFASSYGQRDDAGQASFSSKLWETKDEAETFQQLGEALDPTLLGYTVDLTASDPNRMYVTAVRSPSTEDAVAVLLTSTDRGQTWSEEEVPLVDGERALWIAAVDPNDAERVYLRTSNMVDKPTRLILREAKADGGPPTLRTVYTAKGALAGFALSPDGAKVFVGGPMDGVNVATTQDLQFQHRSDVEVQCLALNAGELWACSSERSGFVAGVSKDDGATFETRLRFCDIQGSLATCEHGTPTNALCSPEWPKQKALLGCGGDGAEIPDAGDSPPPPPPPGNCDCHASPAGPWGAFVSLVGVGVALVRRRRRPTSAE